MRGTLKLAAIVILALGIVGCAAYNRRRAEKAIDAGEYDVADQLLQAVLRRNPGDAEAHLLAGRMLLLTDRTEAGDRELEMAAVADPNLKPRIARLYFDTGVRWVERRTKPAPGASTSRLGVAPPPPSTPPPPPPPPPPAGALNVVKVIPRSFDFEVQTDERLQSYLANAARFDPKLAPTISDWVLKTAKSQLDRQDPKDALAIAKAAPVIDPTGRTRLGTFLLDGAKTCSEQHEDGLASQYAGAACALGQDQVKAAARTMAQLQSQSRDRSFEIGSGSAARCFCQAMEANPSLTRDDEEFAWLMYSGVFQSTGEYLKLFPNGSHAVEARSALRKTRTAPSPCVETPDPGIPGGIVGSVPGGIPGGVMGGVIGGVVGSAPPPPPSPRAAAAPVRSIRIGQNVARANLIREVPPVYPPLAKAARIQGTIRFTIRIGKDGRVENIQLLSGHPLLVAAAQDAVRQWVYKPILLNGEPVQVETQVDVVFRLQ